MTRLKLALAACLALSAAPALAQTAWVEVRDSVMVAPFNLPADDVEDMDVVDAAGKKIGEVEEVLGPNADEATAVAIDFDDNAGLDDRNGDVIVPLAGVELQGKTLRLLGDAATIRGYEIYPD